VPCRQAIESGRKYHRDGADESLAAQNDRIRHALEFVAAAILGDEQARDLPLYPRCHYDRTWLRQRLHPRRYVGRIAINLARRIDHYRTDFNADAR
jgi:hypothetical protein